MSNGIDRSYGTEPVPAFALAAGSVANDTADDFGSSPPVLSDLHLSQDISPYNVAEVVAFLPPAAPPERQAAIDITTAD